MEDPLLDCNFDKLEKTSLTIKDSSGQDIDIDSIYKEIADLLNRTREADIPDEFLLCERLAVKDPLLDPNSLFAGLCLAVLMDTRGWGLTSISRPLNSDDLESLSNSIFSQLEAEKNHFLSNFEQAKDKVREQFLSFHEAILERDNGSSNIGTRESEISSRDDDLSASTANTQFCWTILTDRKLFEGALGTFKINASGKDVTSDVDLRWPEPSVFLKDNKKKQAVWEQIHGGVLPALAKPNRPRKKLNLSDSQLQQLMQMIATSKAVFEVDHPSGYVIGVNKNRGVDVCLSTADLSSMLTASWLFGSEGVRLSLD